MWVLKTLGNNESNSLFSFNGIAYSFLTFPCLPCYFHSINLRYFTLFLPWVTSSARKSRNSLLLLQQLSQRLRKKLPPSVPLLSFSLELSGEMNRVRFELVEKAGFPLGITIILSSSLSIPASRQANEQANERTKPVTLSLICLSKKIDLLSLMVAL